MCFETQCRSYSIKLFQTFKNSVEYCNQHNKEHNEMDKAGSNVFFLKTDF